MSVDIESRISSEACDLLDCFSEELGEVVRAVAEFYARERLKSPDHAVQIERDDVKRAGEALFAGLAQASSQGLLNLKPEVAAILHGMRFCFDRKAR